MAHNHIAGASREDRPQQDSHPQQTTYSGNFIR